MVDPKVLEVALFAELVAEAGTNDYDKVDMEPAVFNKKAYSKLLAFTDHAKEYFYFWKLFNVEADPKGPVMDYELKELGISYITTSGDSLFRSNF